MGDYVPFTSAGFPERMPSLGTGYDIGLQDLMVQAMQQLSMKDQQAVTAKRDAELERYKGMTPGELAKSNLERVIAENASGNPEYAPTINRGVMGQAQQHEAEGKLKMGTVDSGIRSGNADNELKTMHSVLGTIDSYKDYIKVADATEGPGGAQKAWTKMRESLPPAAKEHFPETYDPVKHPKALEDLRASLVDSVKQRQTLEDQRLKNTGALDVAKEHSRGQIAAAALRANKLNTALPQVFRDALIKGDEAILRLYAATKDDPDVSLEWKTKIMAAAQQADKNLRSKEDAKANATPALPGLPGAPPAPSRLGGTTPQVNPGGGSAGTPGLPSWATPVQR